MWIAVLFCVSLYLAAVLAGAVIVGKGIKLADDQDFRWRDEP